MKKYLSKFFVILNSILKINIKMKIYQQMNGKKQIIHIGWRNKRRRLKEYENNLFNSFNSNIKEDDNNNL